MVAEASRGTGNAHPVAPRHAGMYVTQCNSTSSLRCPVKRRERQNPLTGPQLGSARPSAATRCTERLLSSDIFFLLNLASYLLVTRAAPRAPSYTVRSFTKNSFVRVDGQWRKRHVDPPSELRAEWTREVQRYEAKRPEPVRRRPVKVNPMLEAQARRVRARVDDDDTTTPDETSSFFDCMPFFTLSNIKPTLAQLDILDNPNAKLADRRVVLSQLFYSEKFEASGCAHLDEVGPRLCAAILKARGMPKPGGVKASLKQRKSKTKLFLWHTRELLRRLQKLGGRLTPELDAVVVQQCLAADKVLQGEILPSQIYHNIFSDDDPPVTFGPENKRPSETYEGIFHDEEGPATWTTRPDPPVTLDYEDNMPSATYEGIFHEDEGLTTWTTRAGAKDDTRR
ncbi:hypothetical protein EXIGLDRAFT_837323 [Exidia glandulosa HHB12029]|uniref:Uncharacterized protein n=1 Tax=Exidia glandulosa HHB12029 TaxID=1314781 RepID=A0A165GWQ8_EXIGL|nr:hypothetical protein EXIGLDRAFT_837323 [Exidia glandulosa HHB12029]